MLAIKAGTGAAGAGLDCTSNTVVTDAGGDADFVSCEIDKAGTGYIAGDGRGLGRRNSNSFIDAGDDDPARVRHAAESWDAGEPFASQPVVEIRMLRATACARDDSTNITLSKAGWTECHAQLHRWADQEVNNGRATFAGCELNNAGAGTR